MTILHKVRINRLAFFIFAFFTFACDSEVAVFINDSHKYNESLEPNITAKVNDEGFLALEWSAQSSRSGESFDVYIVQQDSTSPKLQLTEAATVEAPLTYEVFAINQSLLSDLKVSSVANVKEKRYVHSEHLSLDAEYIVYIANKLQGRTKKDARVLLLKPHFASLVGASANKGANAEVNLLWNEVAGASSYDIYSDEKMTKILGSSTTSSFTYVPTGNATPSSYWIRARRGALVAKDVYRVDLTGSVISVVKVQARTANGIYKTGDTLTFDVQFNDKVTVYGDAFLPLSLDRGLVNATYISGSGTDTLRYSYVIQNGDDITQLGTASALIGEYADSRGISISSALPVAGSSESLKDLSAVVIDTIPPTLPSSIGFSSLVSSDGLGRIEFVRGVDSNFSLNRTKLCTNSDCAQGCSSSEISTNDFLDLSGLNAGVYFACVQTEDKVGQLSPWSVSLNALTVDKTSPTILAVSSPTADGMFAVGETIEIRVAFSEPVYISTPAAISIPLETGVTDHAAFYSSGSSSSTLSFLYTVEVGDTSSDLNYKASLALGIGGSIKDVAGNNAILALPDASGVASLAALKNFEIDGILPTAPSAITMPGATSFSSNLNVSWTASTDTHFLQHNLKLCTENDCSTGCTAAVTSVASPKILSAATGASYYACVQGEDTFGNKTTFISSSTSTAIDTSNPTVVRVSATTANGYFKATDVITVTVKFSKVVTVGGGGDIGLTLETGTTDQVVTYAGGSGSDTLSFTYTVQPGDTASDLNYASTTALSLGATGSIADSAGHAATLTLPALNDTNALAGQKALVIDTTNPTAPSAIAFPAAVSATTSFSMTWTNSTDTNLRYQNIKICTASDCTTGCRSAATPTASPATVTGVNGGTYYGCVQGEDWLGQTSAFVPSGASVSIDTSITGVSSVSSTTTDGYYKTGDSINVSVQFSGNVTVANGGDILLLLETGATDRSATYVSGSGGSTLVFTYTVQSGDVSADLDYASSSALTLGTNGSIVATNGQNAALALPTVGGASSIAGQKSLVIDTVSPVAPSSVGFASATSSSTTFSMSWTNSTDTNLRYHNTKICTAADCATGCISASTSAVSPKTMTGVDGTTYYGCVQGEDFAGLTSAAVSSVGSVTIDATAPTVTNVSSSTANGYYKTGNTVAITVLFSEVVYATNTGDLGLLLETGTTDQTAVYTSGSGSNTLTFTYTVVSGDTASDLNYDATSALALGTAGTIKDSTGNNANLTLPAVLGASAIAAQKAIVIDTTAPAAPSVVGFAAAQTSSLTFNMTWTASSDTNFRYHNTKICSSNDCATGCETASTSVASPKSMTGVAGTTYYGCVQGEDWAGQTSSYVVSAAAISVDTSAPTVTNVSSSTSDGYYKTGNTVVIAVQFSEVVNVLNTGDLGLILETGTTDRTAVFTTGSGSNTLSFTYIVQSGDTSADLNYSVTNALSVGATGTIKDAAGNDATLTLPAFGGGSAIAAQKAIVIDTTAPLPPSAVSFASPTSSSTTFSMSWTNSTDTNFRYHNTKICTAADCTTGCISDSNSVSTPKTMTGVNGSIYYGCVQGEDLVGLSSSFVASAGTVRVDTTPPTVTNVTSTTTNSSYKAGDVISITMTFSEVVNLTTTGDITLLLETGATDRAATYVSGTGSNTILFTYTVVSGDTSADLNYASTSALSVGTNGTIKDAAGNDANLTLPLTTGGSSIAGQKALTIDTSAPVVTVTTLTTQDNTPPLSGTVDDTSATLSLVLNGVTYTPTNNANGTWSLADNLVTPLAPGVYNVTLNATDPAGNIGTDATTGELTIQVKAFVSTWVTGNTAGSVTTNTKIRLPLVASGTYNFSVNWGDGNTETITAWNAAATTHTYSTSGTYTVTITGTITGFRFAG
ncbi:MAG: hypothetical protein EOP10_06600, partial [Proteobacteria bacterium]